METMRPYISPPGPPMLGGEQRTIGLLIRNMWLLRSWPNNIGHFTSFDPGKSEKSERVQQVATHIETNARKRSPKLQSHSPQDWGTKGASAKFVVFSKTYRLFPEVGGGTSTTPILFSNSHISYSN